MTDESTQRVAAFLAELSALTIKHRLQIGGCGCCGSPWVQEIEGAGEIPPGSHYEVVDGCDYLTFKLSGAE